MKVPLSPEELAAKKQVVCVTGAGGYVAGYIVQRLLAGGHTGGRNPKLNQPLPRPQPHPHSPTPHHSPTHHPTDPSVHAAVRTRSKAAFLEKLPGADKHLRIFEGCDLLFEGCFDAAVAGCSAVVHTASPFMLGNW